MVASTLPSTSRLSIRVMRFIGVVLAPFVVLLLGVVGWFYLQSHAALPQVDGDVRLEGLAAPVAVIRDAQGVPHIRAANIHDLLFAQGYVTAQDRLWQMDALRRASLGELAEIVGPAALEHDRRQRLLLYRSATERARDALPAATREQFQDYARGINAFIASHGDRLPIEFRLLRYTPREWTPTDSLALGLFLHQMLTHEQYRRQLAREKILAKLGPELTADLYPNSSWHDHPPGMEVQRLEEEKSDEDEDEDNDAPSVMRTSRESAPPKFLLLEWGLSVDSEWFSTALPRWLQQLGGLGGPHRLRQAAAFERYAPAAADAEPVVRGTVGDQICRLECAVLRCGGIHPAGDAIRAGRPQPAHRLGRHQPGRRRGGPVHREL
jgi:penicillin amidase